MCNCCRPNGFEDALHDLQHVVPSICWQRIMSEDLERIFPPEHENHTLMLERDGVIVCRWGWKGGTIHVENYGTISITITRLNNVKQ